MVRRGEEHAEKGWRPVRPPPFHLQQRMVGRRQPHDCGRQDIQTEYTKYAGEQDAGLGPLLSDPKDIPQHKEADREKTPASPYAAGCHDGLWGQAKRGGYLCDQHIPEVVITQVGCKADAVRRDG